MLAVLLLVAGSIPAAYAQFNPGNPPEPELNIYHKVTVAASPAAAAYVSGGGKVLQGKSVTLGTSLKNTRYKFSHWTKNGEVYATTTSCTYTASEDAAFVAHYEFVPESPEEPNTINTNRLHLTTNCENQCSFNRTSGLKVEAGTWVTLRATISTGYVFQGWYNGAVKVSESLSFNFEMPAEETTLVARLLYNPVSPSEPEGDGSQENVQTTPTGDVNKDGTVNILDIVGVVNYSLGESDENLQLYDVNGDGSVDILDIVRIVNISLEN